MAKKLTARFVETVKAGMHRVEHVDGHTRGLVLRVTPAGAKSWAVLYRRQSDGRKRRYTVGSYPEFSLEQARTEALDVIARVARGDDPAAKVQHRKQAHTFEQLADVWVRRHGRPNKSPRTLYDDGLMLKNEVLPAIGAMKAEEVKKRDVIQIIDAVADRGARYRSNRVFALVRSIYRWAVAEDLVSIDPTRGIRPRTVERPRERVLTDKEIVQFWRALDESPMTTAVATILRLALVTGQRIGEVAGMSRDEIDLSSANPMWTQSGARRKNRELTRVPLSPLATALIKEAMVTSADSAFVFASPTGSGPMSAHAATRALARARPSLEVDHFRVHDLRRTVATGMAALGINPHTISLVLDHVSVTKGTVTGAVYVKYSFDREKRAALEAWADHLSRLLGSYT